MSARRLETLRLVWLQAFLTVAEYETHSEAARRLGWDQSTVSRYIQRLEAWLGSSLFTGYAPTVLTEEGEAFQPVAQQALDLLNGSRTPEAAASKRPIGDAEARENLNTIYRSLRKRGLSRSALKELGFPNEAIEMVLPGSAIAPKPASGRVDAATIDMSFYTEKDG